jgi:multimeric flavodoxin WrbA
MQRLYPLLKASHRVVLGTPVYFYGVSAHLKAMIDRCQAFWSRKYLLDDPLPGEIGGIDREGYVVSAAASSGRRVFEGVLLTSKNCFDALSLTYGGEMLLRGLDEKGAVLKRKGALDEAFEMGRALGKVSS